MTTIRLAHGGPIEAMKSGLKHGSRAEKPSMLSSFFYREAWAKDRQHLDFSEWVLDSGAFSAFNSGKEIDLNEFVDHCLTLKQNDNKLVEIFALDVIGDHEASIRNCEEMHRQGVDAIPCFHFGEPWDALTHMAENYNKIAIGGVARLKSNSIIDFVEQCFARVWPKKIHGFGIVRPNICEKFPFHTVDSTSWEIGPTAFGNWKTFGSLPLRDIGRYNLTHEVNWYLEFQRRLKFIHGKSLAKIPQAVNK